MARRALVLGGGGVTGVAWEIGRHAVAVVSPDRAAAAIGRNVLDPARRAPAAHAGHAQAGPALDRVGTVWDG